MSSLRAGFKSPRAHVITVQNKASGFEGLQSQSLVLKTEHAFCLEGLAHRHSKAPDTRNKAAHLCLVSISTLSTGDELELAWFSWWVVKGRWPRLVSLIASALEPQAGLGLSNVNSCLDDYR